MTPKQEAALKIAAAHKADPSRLVKDLCAEYGISQSYYDLLINKNTPKKKSKALAKASGVPTRAVTVQMEAPAPARAPMSIVPDGYAAVVLVPLRTLASLIAGGGVA